MGDKKGVNRKFSLFFVGVRVLEGGFVFCVGYVGVCVCGGRVGMHRVSIREWSLRDSSLGVYAQIRTSEWL